MVDDFPRGRCRVEKDCDEEIKMSAASKLNRNSSSVSEQSSIKVQRESVRNTLLQREISESLHNRDLNRLPDHRRKEFYSLLQLASSKLLSDETNEELMEKIRPILTEVTDVTLDKYEAGDSIEQNQNHPKRPILQRRNYSVSKIGMSKESRSELCTQRIQELGELFSITFELNHTNLLSSAINSNNLRVVRFFCYILDSYDELDSSRRSADNGLRHCLSMHNSCGNTALLIAAEKGYVAVAEELILRGSNMIHKNVYRMNALHLAVENNHKSIVKLLLDYAPTHLQIDYSEDLEPSDFKFNPNGSIEKMDKHNRVMWMKNPFGTDKPKKVLNIAPKTYSKKDYQELLGVNPVEESFSIDADNRMPERKQALKIKLIDGIDDGCKITKFVERRVVRDRLTSARCVYEYRPEINGEDSDLWFTKEEFSRWPTDVASNTRLLVDNFHSMKDREILYGAAADDIDQDTLSLVSEPVAIISRECTAASKKYHVAWADPSVLMTSHHESEILKWQFNSKPIGKKLISDFDDKADDIVRLYINARNKYGKSAFISMCEFGKIDILKLVMESCAGKWVTVGDSYGCMRETVLYSTNGIGASCLHFAVKTQNYNLVRYLLDKCQAPNKMIRNEVKFGDAKGDTPLHWLMEMTDDTSIEVGKLLLQTLHDCGESVEDVINEVKPNTYPNSSNNYLMRAAKAGNLDLVKVLLEAGAEKFEDGAELFDTEDFMTAAEYAYESKFFDICYLLNKEMGTRNVAEGFLLRCHTNVRFEYLSDVDRLCDAIHAEKLRVEETLGRTIDNLCNLDETTLKRLLSAYEENESGHKYHGNFRVVGWGVNNGNERNDLVQVDSPSHRNLHESLLLVAISKTVSNNRDFIKVLERDFPYAWEVYSLFKPRNDAKSVDNQLFTYTETVKGVSQLSQRTYLVTMLDANRKPDRDVRQHAMDHYMSRKDLFCRIARLSASDTTMFNSFIRIIGGSRIARPAIFCNEVLQNLYIGFRDDDQVEDTLILGQLTKVYAALESTKNLSAEGDQHYFDNEMKKILYAMREMFESTTSLADIRNLRSILLTNSTLETYKCDVVEVARGMYSDVLAIALDREITLLFGTPQVAGLIDYVLRGNLRRDPSSTERYQVHEDLNIFSFKDVLVKQVKNNSAEGYESLRYSPINMFFFECLSKLAFLGFVSYVSVYQYGEVSDPSLDPAPSPQIWTIYDYIIVIFLVSTLLREVGEYQGNTADSLKESVLPESSKVMRWVTLFSAHFFTNVWNFVDLLGIVLVSVWALTKSDPNYDVEARGALACAAIPMSFGILRYASIEKEMGNLVITTVSMARDFYSFLVVLVICMFGFGVTMRSLFQHDHENVGDDKDLIEGFSTITSTQVTLIDAILGQHDFTQLDGNSPYFALGLFLLGIFILLTMVILFNLLIAKMSTTYELRAEKSLEDWEFAKAEIVKQFLLIGETDPLCMLPAPLNLITSVVGLVHWPYINYTMYGSVFGRNPRGYYLNNDKKKVLSIAGTVSDYILGIFFAPLAATYEIIMDILNIIFSVFDYYEKIRKKKKMVGVNIVAEFSIVNLLMSSVELLGLSLGHIISHVIASPFLFMYYLFNHLKNIFSQSVQLEFVGLHGNQLRIVYALDKASEHVTDKELVENCFRGKFIRGMISRYGSPFEQRPTVIRVKAGPYVYETTPAVLDCSNKLAWKDLPTNSKKLVSFAQPEVVIPAFPYGGNDLIRHLEIDIVEQHSNGEKIAASCHVPGMQLHRWVYDGRFEGGLNMVCHDDILKHRPFNKYSSKDIFIVSAPMTPTQRQSRELPIFDDAPNETELGGRRACNISIDRDKGGTINTIRFQPGSGYSCHDMEAIEQIDPKTGEKFYEIGKKSIVRVFHLLRTGWKECRKGAHSTEMDGILYSTHSQSTIHSMKVRTTGNRTKPAELWQKNTELYPGMTIKYIGKERRKRYDDDDESAQLKYEEDEKLNVDIMNADLNYLRDILNGQFKRIEALYGAEVARLSKEQFGARDDFDTICMVSLKVDLTSPSDSFVETGTKAVSHNLVARRRYDPVLNSVISSAHVQVAFKFTVDMADHFENAASLELERFKDAARQERRNTEDISFAMDKSNYAAQAEGKLHRVHPFDAAGASASSSLRSHGDIYSQIDYEVEDFQHSRFDTNWAKNRELRRLFTISERKKMFNFIDGDLEYLEAED